MPDVGQHADSLRNPGNTKLQQRHWIGVTPMEIELVRRGLTVPGLATRRHGTSALRLRESDCYSGEYGLYHTGRPGCDGAASDVPPEEAVFTLNTAIMAVGEGNYGRLGRAQQQRYTTANRRLQLPRPDEQPGAMPEIAPSPFYEPGGSKDKPFNERAMVLQAWGAYGTAWPVVHQQLGVRPDLGRERLSIVPQLPDGQSRLGGRAIRLGKGEVDVGVVRRHDTYRTTVAVRTRLRHLRLGHTLRRGAQISSVHLDGRPAPYSVRLTNRGQEVTVVAPPRGRHTVVIRTG